MRNKYGTTNPVLIEARVNHDPYDQFAWVQEWRFAIAEYLLFYRDHRVEDFRSAHESRNPTSRLHSLMDDSWAFTVVWELCPTTDTLLYAYRILSRFREWLRIAGEDY